MSIVNKIYKSQLYCYITEPEKIYVILKSLNIKLYSPKPKMLRIKIDHCSILIFNNLKLRLMSVTVGMEEVVDFINKQVLALLPNAYIGDLILQSYTYIDKFNYKVALDRLTYTEFDVNLEIFPCARLRNTKSLCINIFNSSNVIITGAKTTQDTEYYTKLAYRLVLMSESFYKHK